MTIEISNMEVISIHTKPKPWTAPRKGKKGFYSPHTDYKKMLQWQIRCQFNQAPLKGPIEIKTIFYFSPPKDTTFVRRKQMLNNVIHKITRPDLTNILKVLEDAGSGILWEDDNQVVKQTNEKLYGEEDKIILMFKEL